MKKQLKCILVVFATLLVWLSSEMETVTGATAKADTIREFTLDHPRPESRSKWRVPDAYLSPDFDWNAPSAGKSIIVIDAALPDMVPWRKSGLDMNNDSDMKRYVTASIGASYDFGVEKRIIPHRLENDLEFVREYQNDFLQYRQVRKNERGETVRIVSQSDFYLMPKKQTPGRFVYFSCERRCTARADFNETVSMKYSFALEHIKTWREIDQKARDLLTKFYAAQSFLDRGGHYAYSVDRVASQKYLEGCVGTKNNLPDFAGCVGSGLMKDVMTNNDNFSDRAAA